MGADKIQPMSKFAAYFEKYMIVVGVLGQLLFYFQGIKIFMTKSAHDISMTGFLISLISLSSWLVYGILIKNKVLVIANVAGVVGALFVIIGILIHGN